MGNASVGGAKDVSNFTGCMDSNQMPDIASLTYEGLFYDYYFQTKNDDEKEKKDNLINPTYSCAKTKVPIAFSMIKPHDQQSVPRNVDFSCDFSLDELKSMYKEFKAIDTDQDGFITKNEFLNSKIYSDNPLSTNALDNIIDGNKIDFTEFTKALHTSKYPDQNTDVNVNTASTDCTVNSEYEYYMTIGLNSRIDSNNLKRNKLNLIIVLDNSGSMRCTFKNIDNKSQTKRQLPPKCPICNKYLFINQSPDIIMNQHIDSGCSKYIVDNNEQLKLETLSKKEHKCVMDIANQSVVTLLSKLNDDDRFGLIVFNSKPTVYQKLQTVKDINMDKLKENILNIKPNGGTNMESAYKSATKLYHDFFDQKTDLDNDYVKIVYPSPLGSVNDKTPNIPDDNIPSVSKDKVSNVSDDNSDQNTPNDDNVNNGIVDNSNDVVDDVDDADDAKEGVILDEYWNRIIFITDAMPNSGKTDAKSIMNLIQVNSDGNKLCDANIGTKTAKQQIVDTNDNKDNDQQIVPIDDEDKNNIYTTFIGVGLDFNSGLVDEITKVRGCNYYSVHSNDDFIKQMSTEFKFMVTPIAFDFKLTLCAEGNSMCIDSVYGSGDDNKNITFEVMNVSTLFPSSYNDKNEIKGGIVLLKLKKTQNNDIIYNMEINVSYKEVSTGKICNNTQEIVFGERNQNKNDKINDYFDHCGIRKAILLTRYIQLLKYWMKNDKNDKNKGNLLYVSSNYKNMFKAFIPYFKTEMKFINDPVLQKEVDLMQKLVDC